MYCLLTCNMNCLVMSITCWALSKLQDKPCLVSHTVLYHHKGGGEVSDSPGHAQMVD